MTPSQREMVELLVEKLIASLDNTDGDPDFEEQHDREADPAEDGIADWPSLALLLSPAWYRRE